MSYGLSTTVERPFHDAVADVKAALAAEGFGIITEIDMQETLRKKLGVEVEDYVILGACSPGHAYRSLQADPSIGLLLPCNVVVRSRGDSTVVEMINPQMMVDLTQAPEMHEVAREVSERLSAALAAVEQGGTGTT